MKDFNTKENIQNLKRRLEKKSELQFFRFKLSFRKNEFLKTFLNSIKTNGMKKSLFNDKKYIII